eukprot:gnl/MRDRNA2_/MRDRNA2_143894_c0_seq1.p1 gnl/MRDRNA2_/MRDRNA2_143894_c0~~gnl/MRDRNA2_/MRDRNA2_143894_c0_seq1.p1  ORF type:complete len:168 (-),score=44.80 gnl/MRDRNA2_/MRDRNA2_143894_c0_seq1:18-521(-)
MAELLAQEQEAAKLNELRRRFDPSRYHKDDARPGDLGGASKNGTSNQGNDSQLNMSKSIPRSETHDVHKSAFTEEDWAELELFDDDQELALMNDEIEVMMMEIESCLINEIEEAQRRRLLETPPGSIQQHDMNDDDEELMDEILEEVHRNHERDSARTNRVRQTPMH